jgi:dolichyl-phosphate beta-glucosyltransferase
MFLSVIIPCYNEEENLKRGVLDEVYSYLQSQDYRWEVIISDDGSTDNSLEICQKFADNYEEVRVLANKHGGKPWAVWKGIDAAEGEWVLFTDMDQSTPIDQLDKLLPWTKNYDAIVGSRGGVRKNYPLFRKLGAVAFLTLRKLFLLPQIDDTQCGFKLFKQDLISQVFSKLDVLDKEAKGWTVTSYDVELLHMINRREKRIKEVPVDWEDRDESITKGENYFARYFKESRQMAEQIFRVKLNDLKGKYEK